MQQLLRECPTTRYYAQLSRQKRNEGKIKIRKAEE